MHEISIINSAIDIVNESANKNNLKQVDTICLNIGEFNFIENDSLFFIFNILKKGTICENAKLIINNIKGKGRCEYCNKEYLINYSNRNCPNCNRYIDNITSGYELNVYEIEGK